MFKLYITVAKVTTSEDADLPAPVGVVRSKSTLLTLEILPKSFGIFCQQS